MQFTNETPRAAATIAGTEVNIPEPYSEGHTITANEANALNQTVRENVRNNLAKRVKDAEDKSPEAIQQLVDDYLAEYEIGVRRSNGSGTAGLTPEQREIRKLADEAIKSALKARGYKLSGDGENVIDSDKKAELIDAYIEKHDDALRKEAKRRLETAEKLSVDGLGI